MSTHIITIDSPEGDLVDVAYFDSAQCMWDTLRETFGLSSHTPLLGAAQLETGELLRWGRSPCAASDLDYVVVCEGCGDVMHEPEEVQS